MKKKITKPLLAQKPLPTDEAELEKLINDFLKASKDAISSEEFSYTALDMGNLESYASLCGAFGACGHTCDTASGGGSSC